MMAFKGKLAPLWILETPLSLQTPEWSISKQQDVSQRQNLVGLTQQYKNTRTIWSLEVWHEQNNSADALQEVGSDAHGRKTAGRQCQQQETETKWE